MGRRAPDGPLLTVGVTAYNAADSIENAVGSALAQSWRPLEVLVVDDGSTDGTREILRRLEAGHPEIRIVLHEVNRGTAVARNTLIGHALGEAMAFFDDDDISHPERISKQWNRLLAYEQEHGMGFPILCYAGRLQVFPDGSQHQLRAWGTNPTGMGPHGDRLVASLLWGRPATRRHRGNGGTCTQFGRIATYRELGGFDARFRRAQDTELDARLARMGGHLIGVPEVLVTQRLTPATDRNISLQREASRLLLFKHKDAFPSRALFAAAVRWGEASFMVRGGQYSAALRSVALAFLAHPAYTIIRATRYVAETHLHHPRRRGLRAAFSSDPIDPQRHPHRR